MFTPDGVCTILALVFIGACFALAAGLFVCGAILLGIVIVSIIAGVYLTMGDS